MKVNITYPHVARLKRERYDVINFVKWLFFAGALTCVVLNIATGGPAWSLIVLWSMWILWTFAIAPDLVELNRISLCIRLITSVSIMLIIIDMLFPSGWSIEVAPIVCFTGLMLAGTLFFTDIKRQKQNMLPMLQLIAISLIVSFFGAMLWQEESRWALIVLGNIAFILLVICIFTLGSDFIREIKKRFHMR